MEADLETLFATRVAQHGRFRASLWYWRDVLSVCRPQTWADKYRYPPVNQGIMWLNHVKMALRTVRRHRGYSWINITGLAVGMLTCLLIGFYIAYQHSYDQYLPGAENIYRVATTTTIEGAVEASAMGPPQLAPALAGAYPEFAVTRLYYWVYSDVLVRHGEQVFSEARFYRADSTFLEVFPFPLVYGEPTSVLRQPNSILLTASTARRYFGETYPIGQVLTVNDRREYTVTGVVADLPTNSHFQFDFLAFSGTGYPGDWAEKQLWTYLRGPVGFDSATLQGQLPNFVHRHYPPELHDRVTLELQPLTRIHLDSQRAHEVQATGNRTYLYLFGVVGLLLLVMATINFVNLATARAARKAREMSVRKVVGASRAQLMKQVWVEAVVLSTIAGGLTLLGLGAMYMLKVDVGVPVAFLAEAGWTTGAFVVVLVLGVGVLAGWYPAFVLSAFHPLQALKGHVASEHGYRLRRGLVVFQFTITVCVLIGAQVVHRQMVYVQDETLGIEREHVVVVDVPRPVAVSWDWDISVFRSALTQDAAIDAVGGFSIPWERGLERRSLRTTNTALPIERAATTLWVSDDAYADLYGLTLREGRTRIRQFNPDSTAGIQFEFVLNQAAVQELGFDTPIGQDLDIMFEPDVWQRGTVVGVVENFHYQSLHHPITPLVFVYGRGFSDVAVRVAPGRLAEGLAHLADVWQAVAPGRPLHYVFLDAAYEQQYQAEKQARSLFSLFTVLLMVVACLGLLGLAAFTAEQRTKEMGIRKTLGASTFRLFRLLTEDFLRLVGVAFVLAVPLAYWGASAWLAGFAYHAPLTVMPFLLAGGATVLFAVMTVGYEAIKTATANPIQALRSE